MSTKGQQHQQKQDFASSGRGGTGYIQGRTTLITRSGKNSLPSAGNYSMRSSFGGGFLNMAPGTYQNMSHEGVTNVKGKREHEKKELQSLNERLASYIDKVRFLEARNAQLEQELDVYRNQKQADFKPIRDQYETELNQARRVIDELAAEKANYDAKMAGLQDLVDSLKDTNDTLESHNNELRQKIDNQSTQIGSYEGELGTLRLRIESLEDENKHLRELLKKKSDENMALRTDLDNETSAHIEADCRATTLEEEVDFLKALLDKMPQETQKPVLIKGQNLEDFWKNSMSKAIRDIQNEYENKLDIMRQDMEMRMQSQVRQLQSGAVRDNMETTHAKEECKKLKSQSGDLSARVTSLEGMVAALEAERNDLRRKLAMSEDEIAMLKLKHDEDVSKLRSELEQVLLELDTIMDAKLSLELEIACYRQLLETEESRLGMKGIIEQAIGTRSKGAGNLSDIVQQTSLSESTGKLTVSRSARGSIGFAEASHDGKYVSVENTGKGNNAKVQDLTGWKITRQMNSMEKPVVYTFLDGEKLQPGKSIKIYSKGGAEQVTTRNDPNSTYGREADFFSWGTGSGNTKLIDNNGVDKASLKAVFKQ